MSVMKTVLSCASLLLLADALTGEAECDSFSLLQVSRGVDTRRKIGAAKGSADVDVVMAYVPYNFGHSVAAQAHTAMGIDWGDCGVRAPGGDCIGNLKSEKTNCTLKYTPGKYWPEDLAQSYFGNKTVFGILRDPYERMVAQFRGTYRRLHPEIECDVNEGVKRMMRDYIGHVEAGERYVDDCQNLPQAEYFDQPYAATEAIDNRFFPQTMNAFFGAHGLDALKLEAGDIQHVSGCDSKWSADLDQEARALVRQVYKRDFDLLCQKFNYCDLGESTCVLGVPGMCPEQEFAWNTTTAMYEKRQKQA